MMAARFASALGFGTAFTQAGFDLIESGEDGHRACGKTLADFEGFVELASGMRLTGSSMPSLPNVHAA